MKLEFNFLFLPAKLLLEELTVLRLLLLLELRCALLMRFALAFEVASHVGLALPGGGVPPCERCGRCGWCVCDSSSGLVRFYMWTSEDETCGSLAGGTEQVLYITEAGV